MTLLMKLKRLFGGYKPDCEYWVYTKEINVPSEYYKTRIGEAKWQRKLHYWEETGEFESPILLDRDINLVDGFSSVRIAQMNDIQKVPVHFVKE